MAEKTQALVLIGNQKKRTWCRYCETWIDARGFQSHVHFRHARQVLVDFRFTLIRQMGMEWYEELKGS